MRSKYRVEISSKAKKNLKKLDRPIRERMIQSIELLAEDPYTQPHSKKMKGFNGVIFRSRVGTFRVIYEIVDDQLLSYCGNKLVGAIGERD